MYSNNNGMFDNQTILPQIEDRPVELNLHVQPKSILQFIHPVTFPLSQGSTTVLITSPQILVQLDAVPSVPMQVKPKSTLQPTEQPMIFPLSQISEDILIASPHTPEQTEIDPTAPVQLQPLSNVEQL